MIGRTLAHYRIVGELGAGGMGVVYEAEDLKLKRRVALKVLPADVATDEYRLERFRREAESLASLSHPNVVTIYSVDEAEGVHFLIEELVDGQTLASRIPEGGLPQEEFWRLAVPLVEAVAAAHRQGIVHRDLKPGNVMVARDGRVKVLDFGLAKQVSDPGDPLDVTAPLPNGLTVPGARLGTPAYMAPEQVRGQPADPRTDVFALGIVLHEMLTGRAPFQGDSQAELAAAILKEEPARLRSVRADLPAALGERIDRCLAKEPARRYADAAALLESLLEARPAPPSGVWPAIRRRPWVLAAIVVLLAVLAGVAGWQAVRRSAEQRARQELVPRVEALLEEDRFVEAFSLARRVQRLLPADPVLNELIERATSPVSIDTEPPGAEVAIRDMTAPESPWEVIGRTPLDGVRVPESYLAWRFELDGYRQVEMAAASWEGTPRLRLVPEGEGPEGMVRVQSGRVRLGKREVAVGDFWIDRHEVTQRRFQQFVDAGGYGDPALWPGPITLDGRTVSWDEALERFVDSTGRPGPAGWRLGRHPEGEDDHPVRGVSWFEAAAFARWAGRELPTVWHWRAAAGVGGTLVRVSNIGSDRGTAPVGSHRGISLWGAYDMAGNVAEWCWNGVDGLRYQMGGAWSDPDYSFLDPDAQPPESRDPKVGFRTVSYVEPVADELLEPIAQPVHDFSSELSAPDEIFAVYRRQYDYDPAPLDPRIESVDDSPPFWRHELVSYAAAYGGERILAHLYLPAGIPRPLQAVIYVPGSGALELSSSRNLAEFSLMDFVARSGRAFLFPVFDEAYERKTGPNPRHRGPNAVRELIVHWAQDVRRSVDYLRQRDDIDPDRLALMGLSFGAEYAPIYLAVEDRLRAAVLIGGGFDSAHMLDEPPEVQPWHFAPRVTVPTLMVNGRADFIFPLHAAQIPMFERLGPAPEDKRHAVIDGDHLPELDQVIRETLDWLDARLGRVGR